jgi:DNA polymerase III epsilon subunit-like protein
VTGIDPQAVHASPPFIGVANALSTLLLSADTVWFYNAPFDVRILLNSYWAAGLVMPTFNYRCLMQEYAAAYGQPSEKYGWQSQKLTAACEQQGLPQRTAHNALADAQMTAALLRRMRQPEPLVTFGQAYRVNLVSVEKLVARNGNPYASFRSAGGLTVNVFTGSEQESLLANEGYPMRGWLNRLADDVVQPLSTPIEVIVQPNAKGFMDIIEVVSEYVRPVTA